MDVLPILRRWQMDGLRPVWQRVTRDLFQWRRMDSVGTVARRPVLSPSENIKEDTSGPTVNAHKGVTSPTGVGPWEVDVDEMVGGASQPRPLL